MPGQTTSALSRAVPSLVRLADADLKDAELLSSGRHPGNAPALLRLASERLVHAVLATEHGWPLSPGSDLTRIPAENPLRAALSDVVNANRDNGPPMVMKDGGLAAPPNPQELRGSILAARAVLKSLAFAFDVDLLGVDAAGKTSPQRPAPATKPARAAPTVTPVGAARLDATPRAIPAAKPKADDGDVLPRSTRISIPKLTPMPVAEPHDVEGRAAIEVRREAASVAGTPFWTLMERWNIPDQAALDLIGHPGGLTKKGTRPRFKLVGEEAELFRSLQEIDAALNPLGLEPKTWLHQPIKAPPFDGATPAAYLADHRKQGVQAMLRYILQHGLQLSITTSSQGR